LPWGGGGSREFIFPFFYLGQFLMCREFCRFQYPFSVSNLRDRKTKRNREKSETERKKRDRERKTKQERDRREDRRVEKGKSEGEAEAEGRREGEFRDRIQTILESKPYQNPNHTGRAESKPLQTAVFLRPGRFENV
jgi:hypothetical protein